MVPDIWSMTDMIFCHSGSVFLPFCPTNNLKNQDFVKMKNKPGDIILQFCTTNDDHMMFGSWEMECNRIFCHFSPVFALLPLNPENQNYGKMKNTPGDITILHICNILKPYDV